MVIFGANGQLGFALRMVFPNAQCFSHEDADIADHDRIAAIFEHYKPQVVFNAAAYPHAEKAETDVLAAYRVNVLGAMVLARLSEQYGATIVHISTDYVFDGTTASAFTESDLPHPLNVHGLSKHASEEAVIAYATKRYVLRTSALFGPREGMFGNNFVTKRIEQFEKNIPLKMVHDQWTVPTYTIDLARVIEQILTAKIPYGVYHAVNSGGGVTWYDFTREIGSTINAVAEITPTSSGESGSGLNRPARSVLSNQRLAEYGIVFPDWRESLVRYVREYKQ